MDDNDNNSVMSRDGVFQESGNQQDLFSVAPPPDAVSQELPANVTEPDLSLPPPVVEPESSLPGQDTGSGTDSAPVLTNDPRSDRSEPKRPLIFSEGHPLPSRDGGRDLAPAREKKYTASVRRGTVHLSPGDFSADASFGDLLAQARKQSGLSEEQVRQITKLNANYLSALEHSDMAKLPPPVYVSAYIRTLSALYGLDEESVALVQEKLNAADPRAGSGDVPSTLIQSLEKDGVINEQEDKRLRKIFWTFVAVLAFLMLLIITVIVMSLRPRSGDPVDEPSPSASAGVEEPAGMKEPAGKPEFTRAEFDALTMPQVPEASTLQMSRKRAVMPQ